MFLSIEILSCDRFCSLKKFLVVATISIFSIILERCVFSIFQFKDKWLIICRQLHVTTLAQLQEQETFKTLDPTQQQQLTMQVLQASPSLMQHMQQMQQLQTVQQQLTQQIAAAQQSSAATTPTTSLPP